MPRPACETQRVYTTPETHTLTDINDAALTCRTCPLLKQCATQALTAGTTLDERHVGPATGVIQAGVWCKGDQWTANQLARVAGLPAPDLAPTAPAPRPDTCLGCDQPMVPRKFRARTTPNVLTHGAHGYCRICDARRRRQKAYVPKPKHQTLFAWKENHAPTNHTNHHRTRPMPDRPVQLCLFDLPNHQAI